MTSLRSIPSDLSYENEAVDKVSNAGTAKRLLSDIRKLAPAIAARGAEFDAARRLPIDLVQTLKSIGIFRFFVPRSHGGLELDLPTGLKIISALARIDGSVGWSALIAGGTQLIASLLPRDTYEQVYRNGPDVMLAGTIQPAGTAEAVGGGWLVSGRWPFASGCLHAEWLAGNCVITEDSKPLAAPAGQAGPLMRGFVLPARDWQIEDTWYVAGLKGTGSHHIALKNKVVPAENFFDFMSGGPCLPGLLYQAAIQVLPLLHGANAVGIARGAVDDVVELAGTGRQQFKAAVPMRESEIFQAELGRIAAELRAAQALLRVQAASHWRHALAGTLKNEALFVEATQSGTWLVTTCVRIVDACFALAGSSAVYETSPLQRRLRDIHTAAQHATVQQRNYVGAGKLLLVH
jgi:alkylation response protein AidB-like acyl-CoA dehydrogenase